MLLNLWVHFRVWLATVYDRLHGTGETQVALAVITALLGWLSCMVAVQTLVLLALASLLLATGHSPNGPWSTNVSVLGSTLSAVLAYFPLLLIPQIRSTFLSNKSWLALPTMPECHGDGKGNPEDTRTDAIHASADDGGDKHDESAGNPVAVGTDGGSRDGLTAFDDERIPERWPRVVLVSIATAIVVFLLVQVIGACIRLFIGSTPGNDSTDSLSSSVSMMMHGQGAPWAVVLSIIMSVVVMPFMEECLFRGVVTKSLVDSVFARDMAGHRTLTRTIIACVIGGMLFAGVHLVGVSSMPDAIVTFLGLGILGSLFGLIDVRYRSVLPSFISHVVYNAIVVVFMFIGAV